MSSFMWFGDCLARGPLLDEKQGSDRTAASWNKSFIPSFIQVCKSLIKTLLEMAKV